MPKPPWRILVIRKHHPSLERNKELIALVHHGLKHTLDICLEDISQVNSALAMTQPLPFSHSLFLKFVLTVSHLVKLSKKKTIEQWTINRLATKLSSES